MSGDQASGLRQWSQTHTAREDARTVPARLVIMTWQGRGTGPDRLASRLSLPEGVSHWQPHELVLSAPLPEAVPDSPWWVLDLRQLEARSAPGLAEALRALYHTGMPRTVLLNAPDATWASGLISAARAHLGVSLMQEVQAWHQAVTASLTWG
ncbi:hypothetical protein [Kushneria konosiri]|uniref:Uncharacterized protein n=1 Tax=Kushneria konosiri TaxID=698828 RepID=A0A2Z2H6F9_9GAMM|nr:hypothetical protein [Kushneria konosiri]ARS52992.1 hypothetical protein B9G99_08945 [Kushneria konosiri]